MRFSRVTRLAKEVQASWLTMDGYAQTDVTQDHPFKLIIRRGKDKGTNSRAMLPQEAASENGLTILKKQDIESNLGAVMG
jgi:hypothetical protein